MIETFTAPKDDTAYFYEGPSHAPTRPTDESASGSMNTLAIDGWRQGVELTRQKYYDAGTAKVWSGEPGHALYNSEYGANDVIRKTVPFKDIGKFRTISLVLDDARTVFPILVGDNDAPEGVGSDGAIEPLAIRSVVSFYSTYAPFEAHTMRASFMGGNEDIFRGSDEVTSVDEFSDLRTNVPYLDMVDMFEGRIPLNGFFIFDTAKMSPFEDIRYPRNVPTTSQDDEVSGISVSGTFGAGTAIISNVTNLTGIFVGRTLIRSGVVLGKVTSINTTTSAITGSNPIGLNGTLSFQVMDMSVRGALSALEGSTDNYVSSKNVSSTNGWTYDNVVGIGTDSIAFGGMTY